MPVKAGAHKVQIGRPQGRDIPEKMHEYIKIIIYLILQILMTSLRTGAFEILRIPRSSNILRKSPSGELSWMSLGARGPRPIINH